LYSFWHYLPVFIVNLYEKKFSKVKGKMLNLNAKDYFKFQLARLNSLFIRRSLYLLQDMRQRNEVMVDKIKAFLPENYHSLVDAVNCMDEKQYNYYRKRVLDECGDARRDMESHVEKFEIEWKNVPETKE
jgi:hypothetical protein